MLKIFAITIFYDRASDMNSEANSEAMSMLLGKSQVVYIMARLKVLINDLFSGSRKYE